MLRITTIPAILGHTINKPQQSIEQPKAQYNGSTSFAQIRVEATLPKVTIDQTAAFSESGLKNIDTFMRENVQRAKQIAIESVGRNAAQGSRLQDIHKGGNTIKSNARENAIDQFLHTFGMVTMPRSRPEINVIEGELDIQVTEGTISGGYEAQSPNIDYQPGNVERYMEQYNSITIEYLGEQVDLQV